MTQTVLPLVTNERVLSHFWHWCQYSTIFINVHWEFFDNPKQAVDFENLINILISIICTPINLCTFSEGEHKLSPALQAADLQQCSSPPPHLFCFTNQTLDIDFKELSCKILLDLDALSTENNFYVQSLVAFFLFHFFLKHQYVMIQKDFW